jgi:hypothetical protein
MVDGYADCPFFFDATAFAVRGERIPIIDPLSFRCRRPIHYSSPSHWRVERDR